MKWILGGFVGILALGLLATGPAFPWVGKWVVQRVAAAQGIEGDLRIAGSLWGEFSLLDVALDGSKGDSGLISLEIQEATATYSPTRLIFGFNELDWLEAIRIEKASVVLDLPESGEESDERPQGEPKEKSASTEYSPFWNLLDSTLEIQELSLEIRQGDKIYKVGEVALLFDRNQPSQLAIRDITIPESEKAFEASSKIESGNHEISFRELQIGEESEIRFLTVAEPTPGAFRVETELEIAGGVLAAEVDSRGKAEVGLRNGSALDLARLPGAGEPGLPLSGTITHLDLSFDGSFENPSSWSLTGSLVGNSIAWDHYGIPTLAVTLKDENLAIEALRPDTRLVANLRYPYTSAGELESLATVPLLAEANLKVSSLGDLLLDVAGEYSLEGAIQGELKEFEFRDGQVRSGKFLLTSEKLRWKEEAIPQLQAAAMIGSSLTVAIAANMALDTETQLELDGSVDLSSQTYQAEATLGLIVNDRLRDMLSETGIDLRNGSAKLNWKGSGDFKAQDHSGNAELAASDFRYSEGVPFSLTTSLQYSGDTFDVPELRLDSEPLQLSASGNWDGKTIRLTEGRLQQQLTSPGTFTAEIPFQPSSETPALEQDAPIDVNLALEKLGVGPICTLFLETPPVAGELSGTFAAKGRFQNLDAMGDFQFWPARVIDSSREVEIGDSPIVDDLSNSQLDVDFTYLGDVTAPNTWTIDLLADLSGFLWKGKEMETLTLSAKTEKAGSVNRLIARIDGAVSSATLLGNAIIDLTEVPRVSELATSPIELDLDLDAPDLAAPWRDFAPAQWQSIPIAGALDVEVTDGIWDRETLTSGTLRVFSDSFRILDEPVEKIQIDGKVTQPGLIEWTTSLQIDDPSHLEGSGHFEMKEQAYRASIDASIDLESEGVLRRLLAGRNLAALLPARTEAKIDAEGNLNTKTAQGKYEVLARNLLLAPKAAPIREINVKGDFSQESLFATLSLESAPLSLNGVVDWKEGVLELREWIGKADRRDVLALDGKIPLEAESMTTKKWFASDAPLDLDSRIDALSFATVYRLIGQDPPLRGELSLDLALSGSPAKPAVDLDLDLAKLVVSREEAIAAGEISLDLAAANGTAKLEGAYRHPDVNPLQLVASMPFRPSNWVAEKDSFLQEKIALSAKMERSSLAFLASQIPAIESIAGTIALDLAVSGSLATPEINGDGKIEVDRLRLQQPGAPSFYDIELDTSFSKNEVRIDRLSAIIAGGVVEAGGVAKFLPDADPVLDFQLQGREILLFRTPDLSLRTDADIQLQGPFSKVAIRGEVGLVNSRFFKNFDLLPTSISLPDPSSLPSVERGPSGGGAAYSDLNVGVEEAPFSQWTTDLRIYTKDPFLIRSNLVESSLVADVHVGGTLERPAPTGFIEIADGSLSLPFSSVDVDIGRIRFEEKTGFNGAIELKARAKADDYRINAYLYNRVLDPKYVLTSVPPMPAEDILTLLATGTTRDELIGGDPGALAASKAATLLFKNLKKADTNTNREPNLLDELNERTELEIGGINPETGAETIGGKIRLWKQLFFVGNVDAQNDYRAVLKYVFRFR